ncbi:Uncharacterised protein [Vibrio cholerae]|nr:Uncharacterised protein [Vibrio cholerae]
MQCAYNAKAALSHSVPDDWKGSGRAYAFVTDLEDLPR